MKKILFYISLVIGVALLFLFGKSNNINILAINSFESSIGSYNFNIDIDNYDNVNLYDNSLNYCYFNFNSRCSLDNNTMYVSVDYNNTVGQYFGYSIITKNLIDLVEIGETYTFTMFLENNLTLELSALFYANGSVWDNSFTYNKNYITYTITEENFHNNLFIGVYVGNNSSGGGNVNNNIVVKGIMITKGETPPNYYSSPFKFGYDITGKLSILSTSNTSRNFSLSLCNKLSKYDKNGYLIEDGNCFYNITGNINSIGVHNFNINAFLPFDISDDGTITFDMEFYMLYSGSTYSNMYLCPYSDYNSSISCNSSDNSLIFTPILQGYYKGEPSNNIIHSKMNYVSNNFYYKGFYLYGRGAYLNESNTTINYFDTKEYITFRSNDVKTGANLELNSSTNEETWSINTNVASDYIKSTSYYNAININEFFNYSVDITKFFEHNSYFTLEQATGNTTINNYTMFWGFSSINTRVLDSNSSTTPIPGGEDVSNKYNSCSAWYDIPCQLGNAITYVIYEAPIISPIINFFDGLIEPIKQFIRLIDQFSGFGILFGLGITAMLICIIKKMYGGGDS